MNKQKSAQREPRTEKRTTPIAATQFPSYVSVETEPAFLPK